MANDYSLDMFQVEEDELEKKRLQAVAQLLRSSSRPPIQGDFSARFRQSFNDTGARLDLNRIPEQKRALGQRVDEATTHAFRNMPESIRDLSRAPGMRTEAGALAKKYVQSQLDADRRDQMMKGGGQGDLPNLRVRAMALLQSPDESDRKMGKDILTGLRGPAPGQIGEFDENGDLREITGAGPLFDKSLGARERARNPAGMEVDNEYGGKRTVPWSEVPPSKGAASGALPLSAGRVAPTVAGPVSGPISAPSGPSALPLSTSTRPPPIFNFSGNMRPEETAAVTRDTRDYAPDPNPVLPQTMQAAGFSPNTQPRNPVNDTNPVAQELYKQGRIKDFEAYQKHQEMYVNNEKMRMTLDNLEEMNKSPMFGGPLAGALSNAAGLGASFGGSKGKMGQNTDSFDSEVQRVIAPTLKQYGYNPSNVDLIAASKSMPSINQDQATRQNIIGQIRRGLAFEQGVAPMVDDLLRKGYSYIAARR